MLLDIGVGILSSIALSRFFGISLSVAFISAGILFALLPDIDFLASFKKSMGAKGHEHRDILHYPLLFTPIGTIILSFFNYQLAILFALTTFLHFVHDSIGIGWGVQWLYPFSRNHYAFLYQYDSPQKLVYVWTPEEVKKLSDEYGDPDWVKNIYFKFHPYAIVELLVFILAIIVLIKSYL
jgi:membrane-bound metal-dependent hydrolase YbcI (DUF457 family)